MLTIAGIVVGAALLALGVAVFWRSAIARHDRALKNVTVSRAWVMQHHTDDPA
jgi:hypothetical protein